MLSGTGGKRISLTSMMFLIKVALAARTQAIAEVDVVQFRAATRACQLDTPPVVTVASLSMIAARNVSGEGGFASSCLTL